MRKFVAGNWKMNGLKVDLSELVALQAEITHNKPYADVAICLPATLVEPGVATGLPIGGQDCHTKASGAYTGDISAQMLADCGAHYVIVGHSERRDYHNETNEMVAAKSNAATESGLHVIVCVGESLAQREAGAAIDVVTAQLRASIGNAVSPAGLTVAYEPIWAIGTGKIPTLNDVKSMHGALRTTLLDMFGGAGQGVCIQYGGSVKPENASELATLPNVDGFLVGGASLKAASFLAIVRAFG